MRKKLWQECSARSWQLQQIVAKRERFTDGRLLTWIDGKEAANLYRRSHQVRVGVFHTGSSCVRLASGSPITISVEEFVRYKAYASELPNNVGAVTGCLDEYDKWCRSVGCDSIRDPPCFPFHVFRSHHTELETLADRLTFRAKHRRGDGHGSFWRDDNRLNWRLDPRAFHGRETLHVAGHALPPGFHWDVSADREDSPTVTTLAGRWEITGKRGGYLNVYPDGNVRWGRPFARRLPDAS